jgi:Protein of unknown function (DUF1569)
MPGFILLEAGDESMDPYLERLQEAIKSATAGMSAEDLKRHPEGKWSTAEVLEHLYLSYTGTVKGCERCLEVGKPLATISTWRQRVATAVVVGMGYLPSGRQAPSQTRPRGTPAEKVVAEIGSQVESMDEWIGRCEERYGKATKIFDHPVLGPLTGQQWRKFHLVHGQHHVKQILRLRQTF